jgi:hypothetical protein
MVVPSITSVTPNPALVTGLLTVQGKRLFKFGLKSFVFVADLAIEVLEPKMGDPWSPPTDVKVEVPLTAVSASNPPLALPAPYPVRAQMNGAMSVEAPSDNFQ